jgi:hypothetical protein
MKKMGVGMMLCERLLRPASEAEPFQCFRKTLFNAELAKFYRDLMISEADITRLFFRSYKKIHSWWINAGRNGLNLKLDNVTINK